MSLFRWKTTGNAKDGDRSRDELPRKVTLQEHVVEIWSEHQKTTKREFLESQLTTCYNVASNKENNIFLTH